jgi:uracil-DNA glycosylase family 4
MFTGDASGDFLYPALHKNGFSNQPESHSKKDGLELSNIFITAVCRCAPPLNRPSMDEQLNCRGYLLREILLLENLKGIVALGSIAFNNAIVILKNMFELDLKKRPKFRHGGYYSWVKSTIWLLSSYHPSRQNTQTGRLTEAMFSEIWATAAELIANKSIER